MNASASEHTVDEIRSLVDGIVSYKLDESGSSDIQDWIDGPVTNGAGTSSEWYAITIAQYGSYDMSSYRDALERYAENTNVSSATGREKLALALIASGSTNEYISRTIDDSIDQLGLMSWIYGLHLLNNGFTGNLYDTDIVVNELLSSQFEDGGWAIMGKYGDIDVTAMTITALAPHAERQDVYDAVERGFDFLSSQQNDDGGYTSFGTDNPESAAQVLLALSSMGVDCQADERFIKNGNTVIDGILKFRNADGSFCHTLGGPQNESATVQAMYSLVSYIRMSEGKSPLYVMDDHTGDGKKTVQDKNSDIKDKPRNTDSGEVTVSETDASGDEKTQESIHSTTAKTEKTSPTTVSSSVTLVSSSYQSTLATVNTTSLNFTAKTSTNTTFRTNSIVTSSITPNTGSGGYKGIAMLITCGAAVLISAVLFAAGKRHPKNFIAVGAFAVGVIGFIHFTNIQSASDYYNGTSTVKTDSVGTVTLSIRCDTIKDKADSEYIPEDGTILDVTSFDIEEGDTVYDILNEAAQVYGIQVENSGSAGNAHGMVYISAINYLYEMQYGELSGWIYHVNGVSPSVNCGEYILKDGDEIEWLYTCELGYDLEEKQNA